MVGAHTAPSQETLQQLFSLSNAGRESSAQKTLTVCEQDQDIPSWSCSQAVSKPVWHIPLLCVQWKTRDAGGRNCPKHVKFYSKNKFEKLVHLVGFIIRKIKRSVPGVYPTGQSLYQPSYMSAHKQKPNWMSQFTNWIRMENCRPQ